MASREPITEQRRGQLLHLLYAMDLIRRDFYAGASAKGFHEFLEIDGVITETIKICRRMLQEGRDFQEEGPELDEQSAEYIGEKIGCMFHKTIEVDSQQLITALMRGMAKGAGCPEDILNVAFPRGRAKVSVVDAAEIARHPTRSLLARDYVGGGASGEQGEAD